MSNERQLDGGGGLLLVAAAYRAVVGADGRCLGMFGDERVGCAASDTVGAEVLVLGLVLVGLALHGLFLCSFALSYVE